MMTPRVDVNAKIPYNTPKKRDPDRWEESSGGPRGFQGRGYGSIPRSRGRHRREDRDEVLQRRQEGIVLRPEDPRHGDHHHDPDGQRGTGRASGDHGRFGSSLGLQDLEGTRGGARAEAVEPAVPDVHGKAQVRLSVRYRRGAAQPVAPEEREGALLWGTEDAGFGALPAREGDLHREIRHGGGRRGGSSPFPEPVGQRASSRRVGRYGGHRRRWRSGAPDGCRRAEAVSLRRRPVPPGPNALLGFRRLPRRRDRPCPSC